MKIRTDFVTNSSSYSSTNIVIDNPVLMDILIKYKEIGLFEDLGVDLEIAPDSERAFTYNAIDYSHVNPISSLQECLKEIIETMIGFQDDYENQYDKDLFETMIKELRENEDKILEAYNSVHWFHKTLMSGGAYEESYFRFNSENGETYEHERWGNDEDFDF